MSRKRTPINYVNNKELYAAMVVYKAAYNKAIAEGTEKPRIPEYIGICIMKIAEKLATKPNFINYPFREEMIGDGIENCVMYLYNFDPEKYQNAFAYITQIIFFAFIRRIEKEKKALYVKQKLLISSAINDMLAETEEVDKSGQNSYNIDLDNEYMTGLVEKFEAKLLQKKKDKSKKLGKNNEK